MPFHDITFVMPGNTKFEENEIYDEHATMTLKLYNPKMHGIKKDYYISMIQSSLHPTWTVYRGAVDGYQLVLSKRP